MERERQLDWEQQGKVLLDILKSKEASAVEKLERDMSKLKVDLASLVITHMLIIWFFFCYIEHWSVSSLYTVT